MRSSFLQNDKKGIIPLEIAPVIFTSGSLAGPRLPGIIESDLNVRPIAEGLLLGAAASAERIRSPDFSIFSFRVDQGAITFYKEWTVFYNLDLCGGIFSISNRSRSFICQSSGRTSIYDRLDLFRARSLHVYPGLAIVAEHFRQTFHTFPGMLAFFRVPLDN